MTDLEAHVRADGRDELVREVRKQIDALGIEYLYYQFVSVTGRIVGKGTPADHWEKFAEDGFQLVYGATANLFTDRHGDYIGYGPESSELVGIPDPATFVQLPWEKRIGRVFCTCFRNRHEPDEPGSFLTSDCRGNLRRIHEQFTADHGLEMRHGTEPEMMWLKKGADGQPDGGVTRPYCYHIDQLETLRPVVLKLLEYSRAMGLDIIQGDHEDAPGQLELNCTFDDALQTCDRLTTYRQICAEVSARAQHDSPASCRSRSWECRDRGATTTFPCGAAVKTPSRHSATTRCPAWCTTSATERAARTSSCQRPVSVSPQSSACSALAG